VSSIWRPVRERNPARSLMVVVAHPGDEAFGFGGAIAHAAASGAYTVVVCATRGAFDRRLLDRSPAPGGRNRSYQKPLIWRNLDTVREDELRRSVGLLGVRVLRMLDYAEEGLSKVGFDELVGRTEVAFEKAGEPLAYEDDLEEDQVAWRAAKLYQLVVPASALRPLGDRAPDRYGSPDGTDTLTLELGELAQVKLGAIRRHVSQTGSAGPFHDWRPEVRDAFLGTEHYRLARSNLPVPAGAPVSPDESGLWDGLA